MKDKNKSSEGMVKKGGKRQKPPPGTAPVDPPKGQKSKNKWKAALDEISSTPTDIVFVKRSDIEEQINALNHWLHLHAPEMCGKKYVKETKRVMEKTGVVGYITDRLETLRSYLRDGE